MKITNKQYKFYKNLLRYIRKEQRLPSVREMQKINKLKSTRGVSQYLEALEKHKCIKRRKGARNFIIVSAICPFCGAKK